VQFSTWFIARTVLILSWTYYNAQGF